MRYQRQHLHELGTAITHQAHLSTQVEVRWANLSCQMTKASHETACRAQVT